MRTLTCALPTHTFLQPLCFVSLLFFFFFFFELPGKGFAKRRSRLNMSAPLGSGSVPPLHQIFDPLELSPVLFLSADDDDAARKNSLVLVGGCSIARVKNNPPSDSIEKRGPLTQTLLPASARIQLGKGDATRPYSRPTDSPLRIRAFLSGPCLFKGLRLDLSCLFVPSRTSGHVPSETSRSERPGSIAPGSFPQHTRGPTSVGPPARLFE